VENNNHTINIKNVLSKLLFLSLKKIKKKGIRNTENIAKRDKV
jgi:hypothetical protein